MKKYRVVIADREFEGLQDVLDAVEEAQTIAEPLLDRLGAMRPQHLRSGAQVHPAHEVDLVHRLFALVWEKINSAVDAACSLRPVRERVETVIHAEVERMAARFRRPKRTTRRKRRPAAARKAAA